MNLENRNQSGFDGLYDSFYKDVYRFVYSLVGEAEEARDLTQDTFLKLYKYLEKGGRELENPRSWIFRVAANHCYNRVKRIGRFRQIVKRNFNREETASPADIEVMKQQEIEIMRNALEKLPPRDRIILTLFKNGFSTLEMAEMIGVKKSSIGKTLARSVEKLSKQVKSGGLG